MASYLDAGAIVTTGIALVLFAPSLGIGDGTLGALSGLLTLGFAVGAVVGGRLGDRYGRRRVYTATLLLFAVGTALLATAGAVAMLFAGVVLVGLAIGADLPVSLALIAEQAPAGEKGKMIVFSGMLWLLGILAPILLSIAVAPLGELGGRILYGQLLLVCVVVIVARMGLRESAEWAGKSDAAARDGDEIRFSHLGQLFRAPLVAAVLATGLYYAVWNLGANTFGQFGTFLLVQVAGADVQAASVLNLATFPVSIVAALVFMRVVDRPSRRTFFVGGTILNVVAFAVPLVLGFSATSFVVTMVCFGIGAGFCGESIYKVWSQELFPTLLRSTAQGSRSRSPGSSPGSRRSAPP
jgi:inositol transporter-like SP family MFS transporter